MLIYFLFCFFFLSCEYTSINDKNILDTIPDSETYLVLKLT